MKAIFYKDFKNAYIPEILEEIYLNKIYVPFLNKDMNTIVDIGANIGLTSQYFSGFAKRVFAVEPSKTHIEVIDKMLKFNDIKNVKIVDKAVYIENKELTFYHNENTTMFSLHTAIANKPQDNEVVQAITIEKLFNDNKIEVCDFLKLDVEGSEGEIVSHKSFANVAPRIKNMIMEYHVWSGYNPLQLVNALRDYGFKDVDFIKNVKATLIYAIR